MIERVVVGIGLSHKGQDALRWAVANISARAILLVHVIDDTGVRGDPLIGDDIASAARESIDGLVELIRAENPGLSIESEIVRGDPISGLTGYSSTTTVLVLGTARRDGPKFRYAWSVATRIATRAAGPVAIVPAGRNDDPSTEVVVGVDGSPASAAAVLFAAERAVVTGGPLRAVHSWLEPIAWQDSYAPEEQFLDSLEKSHGALLDDSLIEVRRRYPDLDIVRDLVHTTPARALLDAARGASLLVVGNHGRSVAGRLFLGSVSHAVVLRIETPTIVVRDGA